MEYTLIVESGATKTDWIFVADNGSLQQLSGNGLNPVYQSVEHITQEISQVLVNAELANQTHSVYYYGSGCGSSIRQAIISKILGIFFPKSKIEVHHDLLAAARATCINTSGIACILGTGSNSCFFNGTDIADQFLNLGYLMGDEGSGFYLGKLLVQAYAYRELDDELTKAFETFQDTTKLIDNIYGDAPNVFLASLTPFYLQHYQNPIIKLLIRKSFKDFIHFNLLKYANVTKYPIHFVGSIAQLFRNELMEQLQLEDLQLGIIIQKPIGKLVQYHTGFDLSSNLNQ